MQKRSFVWEYYIQESGCLICKLCKKVTKSFGTTSNMIRHLQNKHNILQQETNKKAMTFESLDRNDGEHGNDEDSVQIDDTVQLAEARTVNGTSVLEINEDGTIALDSMRDEPYQHSHVNVEHHHAKKTPFRKFRKTKVRRQLAAMIRRPYGGPIAQFATVADSEQLFCDSLVPRLQALTSRKRSLAHIRIEQILFEIEVAEEN